MIYYTYSSSKWAFVEMNAKRLTENVMWGMVFWLCMWACSMVLMCILELANAEERIVGRSFDRSCVIFNGTQPSQRPCGAWSDHWWSYRHCRRVLAQPYIDTARLMCKAHFILACVIAQLRHVSPVWIRSAGPKCNSCLPDGICMKCWNQVFFPLCILMLDISHAI